MNDTIRSIFNSLPRTVPLEPLRDRWIAGDEIHTGNLFVPKKINLGKVVAAGLVARRPVPDIIREAQAFWYYVSHNCFPIVDETGKVTDSFESEKLINIREEVFRSLEKFYTLEKVIELYRLGPSPLEHWFIQTRANAEAGAGET